MNNPTLWRLEKQHLFLAECTCVRAIPRANATHRSLLTKWLTAPAIASRDGQVQSDEKHEWNASRPLRHTELLVKCDTQQRAGIPSALQLGTTARRTRNLSCTCASQALQQPNTPPFTSPITDHTHSPYYTYERASLKPSLLPFDLR
ncbi:hypothetical protein CBL_00774 [Carabus blaptoides fortunei]